MVKATYKQTFIGIWFHDKHFSVDQEDKMKICLNRTFYYYRIFGDDEHFYNYINEERLVTRIFLTISISNSSLDSIVELTKQYPQIFMKVYIFSSTNILTSTCFSTNNMDDLFTQMNKDIPDLGCVVNDVTTEPRCLNTRLTDKSPPSFSVYNSNFKQNTPIRHLTKDSLHFLCCLTMTDILRRISSYTSEELSEMWTTCRGLYPKNQTQLDYINELAGNYVASKAITYYTGNSCLSRTVNQACHTEDMRQIFAFRVYISDLHKQLVEYYEPHEKDDRLSCMPLLYRGKPLSGSMLQKLVDNEGGLISLNGFLSTTIMEQVASCYHGDDQVSRVKEGYKPVLFVFKINTNVRQPYAHIADCSTKRDEEEVLFSLGTIWRITSVEFNKDPCRIELSACDELDSKLTELREKYIENGCNLSAVGDILSELGDDDEAEWFYNKMVEQSCSDDQTRANLHYKMGMIRLKKPDYFTALHCFEIAASLLPLSVNPPDEIKVPQSHYLCDNRTPLIAIYNNMGLIHQKNGKSTKAITYYKQALDVQYGSQSELAAVHNNLGLLYYDRSNYKEAQEHHLKAIELIDKSHSWWEEFKGNSDRANERCQHLARKNQSDQ